MKKLPLILLLLVLFCIFLFVINKNCSGKTSLQSEPIYTQFERNTQSNSNPMYHPEHITFQIEDLKKPKDVLPETNISDIYKNLILEDLGYSDFEILADKVIVPYNILEQYKGPERLVSFGSHPFFAGIYAAYSDHRPFVLSPDIIWLLITQGFTQHVNNNKEELRNLFVDFDGKRTLIIHQNTEDFKSLSDLCSHFPELIATNIKGELVEVLTNNFSTTTLTSKIVSEITIMEATKPYFEFIGSISVCGIPEIRLEGTTKDWVMLKEKVAYLKKYKLGWWLDELDPILAEFINASEGKVNKEFWRNIVKLKKAEMCGEPDVVNGWIVKFFPYYAKGERTDLNEIAMTDKLAREVVKVDMKLVLTDGNRQEVKTLEIWGGFIGLQQDTTTFTLKPEIGWMICENPNSIQDVFRLKEDQGNISIQMKTVPMELLTLKKLNRLELSFIEVVDIPDELANIEINELYISGEISRKERKRIIKMFPNTKLYINWDLVE